MNCYICGEKNEVIKLAGCHVSQRFYICKICLKEALNARLEECLTYFKKKISVRKVKN